MQTNTPHDMNETTDMTERSSHVPVDPPMSDEAEDLFEMLDEAILTAIKGKGLSYAWYLGDGKAGRGTSTGDLRFRAGVAHDVLEGVYAHHHTSHPDDVTAERDRYRKYLERIAGHESMDISLQEDYLAVVALGKEALHPPEDQDRPGSAYRLVCPCCHVVISTTGPEDAEHQCPACKVWFNPTKPGYRTEDDDTDTEGSS